MTASARQVAATVSGDVTELRLLVELAAVRELTARGLSDAELAAMRRLASASLRAAHCEDARGYLDADASFHAYMVGLTGDCAVLEIGRRLLRRSLAAALEGEDRAADASEHAELVGLLAEDRVSAASDLLRRHVGARRPTRETRP